MEASPWCCKTGDNQEHFAMFFGVPFRLGPFTVDPEGRLFPSDPAAAPAFLFRWHDRVVRARLDQSDADHKSWKLALQTTLARVSSTANVSDETLRPRSFALLRWLERTVPTSWRLSLLADHRVWLELDTPIELPITAVGLITEITRFTLDLTPYLTLMDEIGLTLSHVSEA
jgi:hypothetical protein